MADLPARKHVEVRTSTPASRLISDSELAALRPSPRRDAELVARRALALGLQPHPTVGRAHQIWPFLITLVPVAAYGVAAVVIR